jgi:hypothetical protein
MIASPTDGDGVQVGTGQVFKHSKMFAGAPAETTAKA